MIYQDVFLLQNQRADKVGYPLVSHFIQTINLENHILIHDPTSAIKVGAVVGERQFISIMCNTVEPVRN